MLKAMGDGCAWMIGILAFLVFIVVPWINSFNDVPTP